MLGIVLPVSVLAIALAATFAYLFVKYKRRYAVHSLSHARDKKSPNLEWRCYLVSHTKPGH